MIHIKNLLKDLNILAIRAEFESKTPTELLNKFIEINDSIVEYLVDYERNKRYINATDVRKEVVTIQMLYNVQRRLERLIDSEDTKWLSFVVIYLDLSCDIETYSQVNLIDKEVISYVYA